MRGRRDIAEQIEAVYRARYGTFLRVAAAVTQSEPAAEEAVHDAFVRALRHERRFRGGSLEAWLWRIVVNEARRRRATEARHAVADADVELAGDEPFDAHGRVEELVAALPERQRLVLFLRHYADLDYAAIAAALDIKPGTVAATLHAAHDAVRRQLLEVER